VDCRPWVTTSRRANVVFRPDPRRGGVHLSISKKFATVDRALHRKGRHPNVVVDVRLKRILKRASARKLTFGYSARSGPRMVYSTNPGTPPRRGLPIARMVTFAHTAPDCAEIMWNEQNWTLVRHGRSAVLVPSGTRALRTVRQFNDLPAGCVAAGATVDRSCRGRRNRPRTPESGAQPVRLASGRAGARGRRPRHPRRPFPAKGGGSAPRPPGSPPPGAGREPIPPRTGRGPVRREEWPVTDQCGVGRLAENGHQATQLPALIPGNSARVAASPTLVGHVAPRRPDHRGPTSGIGEGFSARALRRRRLRLGAGVHRRPWPLVERHRASGYTWCAPG